MNRFQARLVDVLSGLNEVYNAFDGRIRADNFRRQILSVLNVWEVLLQLFFYFFQLWISFIQI